MKQKISGGTYTIRLQSIILEYLEQQAQGFESRSETLIRLLKIKPVKK